MPENYKVGLHDSDKEHLKKSKIFPNLALMKISTFHKIMKDDFVEWWNPLKSYDLVYSSKIFDFTPENPYLPPNTIKGGTGYRDIPLSQKLPNEIELQFPDYSLYPSCDFAIGYLTRGCIRKCRWCVVPEKEGDIKPDNKWQNLIRQDSDKLVLLDNNILACDYGIAQLEELGSTKYRIDLNQGMDIRLVTEDIVKVFSSLKWIKYIRFSCDSMSQVEHFERVFPLFDKYRLKSKVFIYLLVTPDLAEADERVQRLTKIYKNFNLYAQAEQNLSMGIVPNKGQREFAQRYIYGRGYKKESWDSYVARNNFQF